jgi:capsule polysaccharide export protein KpsE/RkpR
MEKTATCAIRFLFWLLIIICLLFIGYVGKKRFVKLSLVSTSVTSGLTAGASAILGAAKHNPVA